MDPITESTPTVEKPTVVAKAVGLLYLSLIIGFIAAVVRVASIARLLAGLELFVVIGMGVVFFGLYLLLVRKVSARRNWARVVYLILVLIGLPFVILNNIAELKVSLLSGLVNIILLIAQVAGIALLFTGNANRWFRSRG